MNQQSYDNEMVEHSGGNPTEEIVEALSEGDGGIVVEEKKPLNRSTVVTFVVLVIGAAGVWFMYHRTGPQSVNAAASKETAEAKKTINTFLSGGDSNIQVMETMLRNTQKIVEQFLSYPSMTQIPLSDLRTNPFRVRPQTTGGGSQLDTEAAERRRREEERLAALNAVGGLNLQTIMYGESRRACMINGSLYVEGQQIGQFVIEQINQASVVVKTGPYRFELRMQR